jgi:glycosyltransferase involved in cell wall biosynthesis
LDIGRAETLNMRERGLVLPAGRKRRWTLNGDFVGLRPTGVARYASEVTSALDALVAEGHPLARDLHLDLVAPRHPADTLQLEALPVRVVPEFSRPRLPQFWVQAQLPRHVPGGLVSFSHLAPVLFRRHIVCIHDMHTRLMPGSYTRGFRWAHRLVPPMLGCRAARITTVSELSRRHLIEFGVATARKVVVTYNGSEHALRWDAMRSRLSIDPARPYVLCLGRRDREYKNAGLLVRLAPLLGEMGLDLWMPGDVDEATLRRYAPSKPDNLVLPGRISDDDFKKALVGAVCFLFPSRIEGFGLPAVEAMASGCPVVASTSPCLPEICGDAALYAAPDDLRAWAEIVRLIAVNKDLRNRLVHRGQAQAAKYSWRAIAETYLELMMDVDLEMPAG